MIFGISSFSSLKSNQELVRNTGLRFLQSVSLADNRCETSAVAGVRQRPMSASARRGGSTRLSSFGLNQVLLRARQRQRRPAQPGDRFDGLANTFKLGRGWLRTTGRHHRPNPSVLLEHEIVAIPAPEFVVGRKPA